MLLRCPGCLTQLSVDEMSYDDKVLLQCPECMLVFLSSASGRIGDTIPVSSEAEDDAEEATVLTSDSAPNVDAREFQWNVPGASVTVVEGDKQGIHRKLKGEVVVVGRKGADLEIEDKSVSRRHCEFVKKDDGWWIVDHGSTNGTFLNDERVDGEARLNHLDQVRVGRTGILFAETEAENEIGLDDREAPEDSSPDVTKVDADTREAPIPLPYNREMFLEFMTGKNKGRSVKFSSSQVIIGRSDEADIVIPDDGVSRKHAMIEVHSREQIYVSDLASQNGTWLNGMRIKTTKLILGDLVRLGNTVVKFVVQDVPED